jgi:hypothetical protein
VSGAVRRRLTWATFAPVLAAPFLLAAVAGATGTARWLFAPALAHPYAAVAAICVWLVFTLFMCVLGAEREAQA